MKPLFTPEELAELASIDAEQHREYYAANRDKIAEQHREYRAARKCLIGGGKS